MDQLKKYPFWICATSGASPCGYMEVRGDGMPGFSVLDHDTPVGPKMLLTVSGVEELEVCSDATPFDQDKPQLAVAASGIMNAFLRPHRYLPCDALTNTKDFDVAFKAVSDTKRLTPEILLLESDNSWDCSLHSMLQQHLVLRRASKSDVVLFMWVTHAPNHSSWTPIERKRPVLRRLFLGQHLGASAYPPGTAPS